MKARNPKVVGIDVSSKTLMVSAYGAGRRSRAQRSVALCEEGLADLVKALARDKVELVAMEATGGYERRLLKALSGAKIPSALIQPVRVKDFARSQGRRAKTDPLDCETIANYASVTPLPLWEAPSPALEAAIALGRHRDALIRDRTREKNRLKTATVVFVRESIKGHIASLTKQAKAVEKQLMVQIMEEPQNVARVELLKSVPGVGALTAARLVAELPELGALRISEISSLAGLAPMNQDSGAHEGKRRCAPGRRQIRTAMFQAAHSGVLFNPVIRAHYVRLRSKGKERKVALIACAHKLLRILDAMVRRDERWDAARHPAGLAAMTEAEQTAIESDLAELEVGDDATNISSEPTSSSTTTGSGLASPCNAVKSTTRKARPRSAGKAASSTRQGRPTRLVAGTKHS